MSKWQFVNITKLQRIVNTLGNSTKVLQDFDLDVSQLLNIEAGIHY